MVTLETPPPVGGLGRASGQWWTLLRPDVDGREARPEERDGRERTWCNLIRGGPEDSPAPRARHSAPRSRPGYPTGLLPVCKAQISRQALAPTLGTGPKPAVLETRWRPRGTAAYDQPRAPRLPLHSPPPRAPPAPTDRPRTQSSPLAGPPSHARSPGAPPRRLDHVTVPREPTPGHP